MKCSSHDFGGGCCSISIKSCKLFRTGWYIIRLLPRVWRPAEPQSAVCWERCREDPRRLPPYPALFQVSSYLFLLKKKKKNGSDTIKVFCEEILLSYFQLWKPWKKGHHFCFIGYSSKCVCFWNSKSIYLTQKYLLSLHFLAGSTVGWLWSLMTTNLRRWRPLEKMAVDWHLYQENEFGWN